MKSMRKRIISTSGTHLWALLTRPKTGPSTSGDISDPWVVRAVAINNRGRCSERVGNLWETYDFHGKPAENRWFPWETYGKSMIFMGNLKEIHEQAMIFWETYETSMGSLWFYGKSMGNLWENLWFSWDFPRQGVTQSKISDVSRTGHSNTSKIE